MKKNNNLIVADSTPLGQAGKPVFVDNSHLQIAQQREQARAQRSANINARANERHLKEMIEIVATRDYGNKKTARRFELSPELHLITEMREVLKRGAFPAYAYDNGSINIVTVSDPNNYDVAAAGEYYYNVQGKLRTFDATLTNMIVGYTKALTMLIDDYPVDDDKGGIKDLLMREFVDQVHRKTKGDVEAGVQVNFIEDYELIKETSGCEPTLKLLDRCYARIEDIESGLATYEQHDEELYFSPSPYPVLNEQEQKRFLNAYKNTAHKEFAEFFNGFDYVASSSFDFMMNFLIQMKDALIDCETPFGENLSSHTGAPLTSAASHIQAVTDLKNSIRKKGQLLSALSYCIEMGWDKAPTSQTLTANTLYRTTVKVWIDDLLASLHIGPLPDTEPLFKDEEFINSIYLNNDPLPLIDNILRVWLHAKKVIVQMEVAYDRDYMPLYNFITDDYEHGQHFSVGKGQNGGDRRVTVDEFYELINEYTEKAREGVLLEIKPYKRMYN